MFSMYKHKKVHPRQYVLTPNIPWFQVFLEIKGFLVILLFIQDSQTKRSSRIKVSRFDQYLDPI